MYPLLSSPLPHAVTTTSHSPYLMLHHHCYSTYQTLYLFPHQPNVMMSCYYNLLILLFLTWCLSTPSSHLIVNITSNPHHPHIYQNLSSSCYTYFLLFVSLCPIPLLAIIPLTSFCTPSHSNPKFSLSSHAVPDNSYLSPFMLYLTSYFHLHHTEHDLY